MLFLFWCQISLSQKLNFVNLGDLSAPFKLKQKNFFCNNRIISMTLVIPKDNLETLIWRRLLLLHKGKFQKPTATAPLLSLKIPFLISIVLMEISGDGDMLHLFLVVHPGCYDDDDRNLAGEHSPSTSRGRKHSYNL